MYKRERNELKKEKTKKQLKTYALLRFVAEERIWNSYCLVTHSYLYYYYCICNVAILGTKVYLYYDFPQAKV